MFCQCTAAAVTLRRPQQFNVKQDAVAWATEDALPRTCPCLEDANVLAHAFSSSLSIALAVSSALAHALASAIVVTVRTWTVKHVSYATGIECDSINFRGLADNIALTDVLQAHIVCLHVQTKVLLPS